jgi:signal transduction histidine kinase
LILNYLIREREKAQIELQEAHDQLEERVKQRTAELKFQITARKESEVQSKAVLGERTRLAQELHDTVQQTLSGIAFQLDTAIKLHGRTPERMMTHLELARNLMAKSQVEVRRSVWDLRCRALEQFDLPSALLGSARQITYGTGIHVDLETKGPARSLSETVEVNLLRIGQEAVTNVIKHSRATRVKLVLEFCPERIELDITDDGVGFSLENCAGPQNGHFGLLGMSERAKRLGGRLAINSSPGNGTTVRVDVPLNFVPDAPPTAPSNGEYSHEEPRKNPDPDR